jgi:hypothetical protein
VDVWANQAKAFFSERNAKTKVFLLEAASGDQAVDKKIFELSNQRRDLFELQIEMGARHSTSGRQRQIYRRMLKKYREREEPICSMLNMSDYTFHSWKAIDALMKEFSIRVLLENVFLTNEVRSLVADTFKKYLESLLGQQILSLMDTGSIKKIDII